MKKKILGIFVSLLVVAMIALPMSAAFAEKPTIELTLSGTYYIVGGGSVKVIDAGESGNDLIKIKGVGSIWTGDIEGSGIYNGNWLFKSPGVGAFPGKFILEDVTIAGRTGDLTIGAWENDAWIECGSGELRSIRGKGTLTTISMVEWDYEFEVQINPLKD